MKVVNAKGELLVANRPLVSSQVLFDPATGTFVKPTLVMEGGIVNWSFEPCDPPETYYDPISGKTYFPALVNQDGVITWTFNEKT